MKRFSIIRECWKHGDLDASAVLARFDTKAEAEAWLAANAEPQRGDGADEVVVRIDAHDELCRDTPTPFALFEQALAVGGLAALYGRIDSERSWSPRLRHRVASAVRVDEELLRDYPSSLLQQLYPVLRFGDPEDERLAARWASMEIRPWLRAIGRGEHDEGPTNIYNSLQLSPLQDVFLILGSQGELWSVAETRRLWRCPKYMARDVRFTADGLALVGHDIDTAGMTDRNPYCVAWDVHTGDEIYYSDSYGGGPVPYRPTVDPPRSDLSLARRTNAALQTIGWDIGRRGSVVARLPGRIASCVATRDGRIVLAIEPRIVTVYEFANAEA